MDKYTRAAFIYAAIVTIGGFVFGLDAAVISGTVKFIAIEFALDDIQIGNVVSAPALGVLIALVVTGAICERFGRKKTLILIALLYVVSAIGSAFAPSYYSLVAARFLGGLAFTSLSLASMYIGEIAPASQRGKLVSMNQIMIVIGLTAAYFSNYALIQIQDVGPFLQSIGFVQQDIWRWMLGMEIIPAMLWCSLLLFIPESPRWLMSKGLEPEAKRTLAKLMPEDKIEAEIGSIKDSLEKDKPAESGFVKQMLQLTEKKFRLALMVGVIFAFVQPLTGVNPILFYAPMVFEQTGIGTNAAYEQSLIIGIVSFIFTALAISLVDKIGRRPLVNGGLIASIICLMMCVFAFKQATYEITQQDLVKLSQNTEINVSQLQPIIDTTFSSDTDFKDAVKPLIGEDNFRLYESQLIQTSVNINAMLVLVGIVGFIAAFHISIGPIMWVVFSEIVPTQIRGVAIPMFALICSTISYFMQKFFPWQLKHMGAGDIFLSYAAAGIIGFYLLYRYLPETKNRSIEEVEAILLAKSEVK
ncbi:sugar porter family MFS transporter [Psychrosphaera sp. F3M07]|uniref:sugar porter family MFS transporter n=1 Tax=Psychrosphaera sp. F3M07 TaxID=2841560 RepID=UPI001C0A0268|nr:sugar porter family MFS transporter [Psychrosphaera sp. F3M07]MBU2918854.1 sugar porter family MFS transporter [Psychrosphaera sp. F3M07]